MLRISIILDEYEMVKRKLISKYGPFTSDNYWEQDNELMWLYQRKNEWHLSIFYLNNIVSHLTNLKTYLNEKKEKNRRKIDSAF